MPADVDAHPQRASVSFEEASDKATELLREHAVSDVSQLTDMTTAALFPNSTATPEDADAIVRASTLTWLKRAAARHAWPREVTR